MFRIIKKIFHVFLLFFLALAGCFCLFFLYLHPINLSSILAGKIYAASEMSNSASVQLNPVNRIALQLENRDKELTAREEAFNNRLAEIEKKNSIWRSSLALSIVVVLGILSVLVFVNFYFDSRRRKEIEKLEAERRVV